MGALRYRQVMLVLGVLLAALVLALVAQPAQAWDAASPQLIQAQEDRFWNYDRESTVATSTNCDWPVTIVFWGHASVAKVKLRLLSALPIFGVKEYLEVSDDGGTTWYWDADRGAKSISLTKALHMRLYAGPRGRLTNSVWGSYVVASTHFDLSELSKNPTSGYSETAAAAVEALCVRAFGAAAVVPDVLPLSNREGDRSQTRPNSRGGLDTHYWQCDGFATMVYVP